MSCDASGREGLLTHPGPAVLLSALATCLSDALGLPLVNTPAEPSSLWSAAAKKLQTTATASAQQRSLADCFATQTVAATARILENIIRSPRFLVSCVLCCLLGVSFSVSSLIIYSIFDVYLQQTLVRSSDCFTSLQDVVEAAIAPAPSKGANGNSANATTSAPVACLSVLLDSLSAASDDPVLRRTMVAKPNFVINLANCAIRHVTLMVDER